MNITRVLDIKEALKRKSCFLFGPRQTGKSWLIRHFFPKNPVYNLLDNDIYLKLSRRPSILREENEGRSGDVIIIDEIQKLPLLLDEVHLLIEEKGIRFLLTGSSARKLKRQGVNLLGGRAHTKHLHPFCFSELGGHFELMKALNHGLLPPIYFSDTPEEDLKTYSGTYLKEEIAAEALTRNIPAFSRFLEVAALCNGQMINYSKISNDAQVARSTVQEYFHILQDTLIAFELPAWLATKKRKPVSTAKLYFFDTGVVRHLQNRGMVRPGSPEMGEAFETYLFHELRSYSDYLSLRPLSYWRSLSGYEVDFILNDQTAIEVTASRTVGAHDCKGLLALKEEGIVKRAIVVCLESTKRIVHGIEITPWKQFLTSLWQGEYK